VAFFEKDFIEQVRIANDLLTVMKEHGEIIRDRNGRRNAIWECSCPGKKTNNKSRINKDDQLHNCFSCGRSGSVFNYIMDQLGVEFPKAVEILAHRAGIPLPNNAEDMDMMKRDSAAYEFAMEFYQGFTSDYFKTRGLDPEDVMLFKAGYAPGGTRLASHMILNGYDPEYLIEIGLINEIDGVCMDALFKRIVFPIYHNGYLINLYGRRADLSENNKHHMVNRTKICFNIDEVKPGQAVILVESLMNAAVLVKELKKHQDMIKKVFKKGVSVVAAGGCSRFTSYHANLLKRKQAAAVFVCYDPDAPEKGKQVARSQEEAVKTGKLIEKKEILTRIMDMPPGVDVNDFFVKEGRSFEEFFTFMASAVTVQTYEHLLQLKKMSRELIEKFLNDRFRAS
jgi:DNA primase